MNATKDQKRLIHCLTKDRKLKSEMVQWATQDKSKTSCNDLSFSQANLIIAQMGADPVLPPTDSDRYWGGFKKDNTKHLYILSLLRQLGWTTEVKGQVFGDVERLGAFLKSNRSPVKKPLRKMNKTECSKIIHALEAMVIKA